MSVTVADPMTPREIDALAWRLADGVADTVREFLADKPVVLDLRDEPPPTAVPPLRVNPAWTLEGGQRWR